MSKQIITQELLRTMFEYRNDGHLIWRENFAPGARQGTVAGCFGTRRYAKIGLFGKSYSLHRLVFLWHHGWLPIKVDHANLNKRDNRVENLRPASHSQNTHNVGKSKANKSGVKGVCWHKRDKKWAAYCNVGKVHYNLGYFDALTDAEAAVKAFREQHHGEFACHG